MELMTQTSGRKKNNLELKNNMQKKWKYIAIAII